MLNRTFNLYKTTFSGLSPENWLLSLVILINRSGTMVIPFLTLYLTGKTMNRSLSEAGTVMGLFGLGSIIGAFFGGKLSDKIGFHKVQIMTLLMGGIMFMTLGQVKSYPIICVCTFVLSLVNEAFRPANSSAIAFYSKPENRTRSYSLNRLAINLGWAVGTSVGGLIASIDYELLFWVDGRTNIAGAILLIIFLKPVIKKKETPGKEKTMIIQTPYKDKIYLWFIFLVMLFAFCFFQLFTTVPKFFRDEMHLSERYIGFVMAFNGILIVVIEMVLVYYLDGKRRPLTYVTVGLIICSLAYFSLLLPGNPKLVVMLMILLITVGEICAMPFSTSFWTSRSNDNNRGAYAALYTMAWGTAQALGPFLCSHLIEATSFKVAFIVMGCILLAASMGFNRLNKLDAYHTR